MSTKENKIISISDFQAQRLNQLKRGLEQISALETIPLINRTEENKFNLSAMKKGVFAFYREVAYDPGIDNSDGNETLTVNSDLKYVADKTILFYRQKNSK